MLEHKEMKALQLEGCRVLKSLVLPEYLISPILAQTQKLLLHKVYAS